MIFRLGRILTGGAKGPGLFFILPCIDNLVTVDLRTITFDVPPQEVYSIKQYLKLNKTNLMIYNLDLDKRFGNCNC